MRRNLTSCLCPVSCFHSSGLPYGKLTPCGWILPSSPLVVAWMARSCYNMAAHPNLDVVRVIDSASERQAAWWGPSGGPQSRITQPSGPCHKISRPKCNSLTVVTAKIKNQSMELGGM